MPFSVGDVVRFSALAFDTVGIGYDRFNQRMTGTGVITRLGRNHLGSTIYCVEFPEDIRWVAGCWLCRQPRSYAEAAARHVNETFGHGEG